MEPKEPVKQKSKVSTIIILVIIAVVAIVIGAWIYNFYNQNIAGNGTAKTSPSPSAVGPLNLKPSPSRASENSEGSWTLKMQDSTVSSAPATQLNGTDSGSVDFEMPAEGRSFTATGDWSGQTSGTSGPSTINGTVNGKMQITGEVKNGKLHFTVSYSYTQCETNIVTPIGSQTETTCPEPIAGHSVDIDLVSGATASQNISSSAVTGTENWTLTKR